MPPIIYNVNNAIVRDKMVSFDYDWILVSPKTVKHFNPILMIKYGYILIFLKK